MGIANQVIPRAWLQELRTMCEHHPNLHLALELTEVLARTGKHYTSWVLHISLC